MLRRYRLLAICLTAIALCACGQSGGEMPKTVQLAESGTLPGSAVGLKVGDTLQLVLDGNASTGYTWEIGFIDSVVLQSLGDPAYTELDEGGTVGGAGQYTFLFSAAGEGQVELILIYHRPLEPDVPPLKTFKVTVHVAA